MIAAFLRFWNLGAGDPMGDEAIYGFRSVGLIDFVASKDQTTPFDWFDPHIPWWVHISFHDAPPLVFWIQHVSIMLFGETTFAFRFPSALFGVGSVYLLYLFGRALFSERAGLIAAALLAVTENHIFISRLGLLESITIFFLILALYGFFYGLRNPRYFYLFGLASGLGFLSKYTAGVLIPISLSYIVIFRRDLLKERRLWSAYGIFLLITLPIWIYNYELYRAVGHFDFQFSYIFRQHPREWQIMPGREIGSVLHRLRIFIPNLVASSSWLFLSLSGVAFFCFLLQLIRRPVSALRQHGLLFLALGWIFVFLILTGPAERFLTVLTPFLALLVAAQITNTRLSVLFLGCLICVLLFEIGYASNSLIRNFPSGNAPWLYSHNRYENFHWGYSELGAFLDDKLKDKYPQVKFDTRFHFIDEAQESSIAKARAEGEKPIALLIVFDENVFNTPQLWFLDRLQIYHGWPVLKAQNYLEEVSRHGENIFKQNGFEKIYFIVPSLNIPWRQDGQTPYGQLLEEKLREKKLSSQVIWNEHGEEAFRVYQF